MLNKIDVLSQILHSIRKQHESGDNVPTHQDLLNAIQIRREDDFVNGINPESMLLNTNNEDAISAPVLFVSNNALRSSQEIRRRLRAPNLKAIFEKSRIISFDDWAEFNDASELWDRLRTEVIKPLARRDFEFIFYMGNFSGRPSFEVDEFLDIMSDFSLNGNVTLVINDKETSELWKLLTGTEPTRSSESSDPGKFIFNATNICRLLVYSPNHRITIYSREGRQEWIGRDLFSPNVMGAGKEYFNLGFVLGLLLQLGTLHCTALGLTLSGAYLRNEDIHDLKSLLAYIRNWIDELDQQLVEH